jgi:fucose permease
MKAEVWEYVPLGATPGDASATARERRRAWLLAAYFTLLFFLYGAFENSVSGWIPTFALRYAHTTEAAAALSTTVLWTGITAGRAVGLLLLRFFSERQLQLLSLLVAVVTSGLLFFVDSPAKMLALTLSIGCGLAAFVPVTVSLFLGEAQPTARVGGFVLATNALGGACLPWLVGVLSQRLNSLRIALELPTIVGALLLLFCLLPLARTAATIHSGRGVA